MDILYVHCIGKSQWLSAKYEEGEETTEDPDIEDTTQQTEQEQEDNG